MPRSVLELRSDALRIWTAGLDAVRSDRLMRDAVRVEGRRLIVGPEAIDLDGVRRIAVVGAGKAGAGMAAALESILGPALMDQKQLAGWVNVPDDCVTAQMQPLRIHLHAARPPGKNEPTAAGAAGAEAILRIAASLGPDDLCMALISGGGSALLPAPIDGITLADKLWVTRFLSAAGADIVELNTVRKQLSRIKGGGLARACRAGRMIGLVISDVLGDALELVASGPTVPDTSTAQDALSVLELFAARQAPVPAAVPAALQRRASSSEKPAPITCRLDNFVIGNNATAVEGARREALRLGYAPTISCAQRSDGAAELIGRHLADLAAMMRTTAGDNCLISGGEATVKLVPDSERGLGGRNQQTILAALVRLTELDPRGAAILSAGTDGEDGPTDAAGAFVDAPIIEAAQRLGLNAADHLRRNDAYRFFHPLGGLVKTGPTHTNVCDVRVVVVANEPS